MNTRQQLETFTACVFEPDDIVEIRRIPPKASSWCRARDLPDQADSLAANNAEGHNIYVGGNPRIRKGNGIDADECRPRGGGLCGKCDKCVALARTVFVDFDDNTTVDQARQRIGDAGMPIPTLLLVSGHGVHAYWRLSKSMTDLEAWRLCQKRLIALLDTDDGVHNTSRVMRLPGFTNHKPPKALSAIIDADPERTYELSTLCVKPSDFTQSTQSAQSTQEYTRGHRPSVLNGSVEEAIRRTLPCGPGQRRRKVFDLCRELQANPELAKADPLDLEPILREWFTRALPHIEHKDFDTTLADFVDSWPRVRTPVGQGTLDDVLAAVKDQTPPPELARLPERWCRLGLVCQELQRRAGDGSFFLGSRTAGSLLNVTPPTAWSIVRDLERRGLLVRASTGSMSGRRATEWYFKMGENNA